MGKMVKGLVKFTVAAAAVGGVCYAFRDKIKESEAYKKNNVDEKIAKVKTSIKENEKLNNIKATLKEKMPKVFDNEKDIVDENEIFVEGEVAERDYVSLDPEAAEESEEAAEEEAEEA